MMFLLLKCPGDDKIAAPVANFYVGPHHFSGLSNRAEETAMSDIEYVEKLSLQDKFRLVEIAHETKDAEIRCAALSLLRQSQLVMLVPKDRFATQDKAIADDGAFRLIEPQ